MHDTSSVTSSEILVENTKACLEEISMALFMYEIRPNQLQEKKMGSKFLADAGFQSNATGSIFVIASLTDGSKKKKTPCISKCLTLPVRAEYIYSAASHASRPDGVLILRDFRKVVK
jgi:hypothetical protein